MCTFNVSKVCQKMTEYGVHFHRVLPEKRSQTGIMLGVFCKGVLIFEVLNGNRTPVLRFPWRETKKISFNVRRVAASLTVASLLDINHRCDCHTAEKEDLPSEHVGRDQALVPDGQQQDLPVFAAAVLRPAQVPSADEGASEQPGAAGSGWVQPHGVEGFRLSNSAVTSETFSAKRHENLFRPKRSIWKCRG